MDVRAPHQDEVLRIGLGPGEGLRATQEAVDDQGRTVEGPEDEVDVLTAVRGARVRILDARGRRCLEVAAVEVEAQDPAQSRHDIEAGLTALAPILAVVAAHVAVRVLSQLAPVGVREAQQYGHEQAVRTVDTASRTLKISETASPGAEVAAALRPVSEKD